MFNKVQSILNRFGIKISRYQDPFNLNLYENFNNSSIEKGLFYNVGAGSFYHPYWKNIDFVSDWYKGVQKNVIHHDLMSENTLPIQKGTAKIIYTSHTIEHIKEQSIQKLFNEVYHSLYKGGIFRITTGPDAETDFRALQLGDENWFYWDRMYIKKGSYEHVYTEPPTNVSLAERWLHHVATPLSRIDISPSSIKLNEEEILSAIDQYGFPNVLDYFCSLIDFDPKRPGNHISWWTHEKIFSFLKNSGFKTYYRSGYNQSASPLMRHSSLFDSTHPQMSIYVEAIKD